MTEGKQTVAGAYAQMKSHEDLCAERYANINANIAELKLGARWIIGLLVALLGWFAVQVWDGTERDIARANERTSEAASTVGLAPARHDFSRR